MTAWRIYNVASEAGNFISRFDGAEHYSTNTNTAGFDSTCYLGRALSDYYLDGDVAPARYDLYLEVRPLGFIRSFPTHREAEAWRDTRCGR